MTTEYDSPEEESVWGAVEALGRCGLLNAMSAMLLYFESEAVPVIRNVAPDKTSTEWRIDLSKRVAPVR